MSLARKITAYVLLFSGLFTLMGTGLQLFLDYKEDFSRVEATIALIEASHIDSLSHSVWFYDELSVETKLSELVNLPDIAYLELLAPPQLSITKGELPELHLQVVREFKLSFQVEADAEILSVGSLKVVVTLEHIYQSLLDKLFTILLTQAVKVLFVLIFITFLVYMLVTRHLEKISKFMTMTTLSSLYKTSGLQVEELSLDRKNAKDELTILVNSINIMRSDLKKGLEEKTTIEQELNRLRNYLSNIFDSMPSVLIGVDSEGKVTQWNNRAQLATSVPVGEAIGQSLESVFPRLSGEMERINHTIATGKEERDLKRSFQKNGKLCFEDMTIYPLVADGVEGAVIRLDDITEKNTNEIALRRAQKMDAIGQLTGGIAHDFNNILGIVMGNLQILEMKLAGNDDALTRIKKALKGTLRGADITRRLLRFSRFQSPDTELTDANKIIRNMDELVAKSLTVSIELQTHFSEDLWPVNINPGDLEDTILNLSLNAKDAMPKGGSLIIETFNKVIDYDYVRYNPESKVGDFVVISMSDNGSGMTEETKNKVLEPFFTTKEHGIGTGLGLSMVYGFVKRSGGHIKIYSEVGEGTTIHLFLPRAEKAAETAVDKEHPFAELPRGTETILIVDDEDELIDIASEYLTHLGYSILTAVDAKQALKQLNANKHIDLIFSDIIMPGHLDGYQLAETIHKERPSLKILLASGFTKKREDSTGVANEYLLGLAKNRLHKPYTQSELAIAIRSTLDKS